MAVHTRWSVLVLGVLVLITCSSCAYAYPYKPTDTQVSRCVSWLESQQRADGCIGDSCWVTVALAAADTDPHTVRTSPSSPSIVDYLKTSGGSLSSALACEKYVMAICAAGESPNDFGGHNYTHDLIGFYSNTTGQMGSTTQLNDDTYGIMALVAAGVKPSSTMVQRTASFIKSHQNADGGWSWGAGFPSDVDSTAAAILALIMAGESPTSTSITKGLSYIRSMQNSDGGFPSDATHPQSNANSDALGIMAIRAAGGDPTGAAWTNNGSTPVDNLLSLQLPSGAFEYGGKADMMATYQALIAITGKFYPQHGYKNHLRIEGKNGTLFDDDLFYTAPYVVVVDTSGNQSMLNGSYAAVQLETFEDITGIPVYTNDSTGGYTVEGIGGEMSAGEDGWRYAVNYVNQSAGADTWVLTEGDEVLWYYGAPTSRLSMLDVPATVEVNTTFSALMRYFNISSGWMPLREAYVWSNGTPIAGPTDASGMVNLSFNSTGTYTLWCAGKRSPEYPAGCWKEVIRSRKVRLEVVPHMPTAIAIVNHTINNAGYPVYLNGSESHDSGTIASYLWHLGDGTEATGASVSHVYASYRWNGMAYKPFMVRLTVRDSSGAANTTTVPVSVYMAGDANGDGRANILDAALVGLHWQSAYGSAEYSDGADLNNDNVVNILDAAIVGLSWNARAGVSEP